MGEKDMNTENTENTQDKTKTDLDNQSSQDSGNQDDNNSQDDSTQNDSGNQDFDSLPDWAQKQIKDLRSESAKHRTSNRTLETRFEQLEAGMKSALGLSEDDKLTPEEQIQGLAGENESLSVQNAVLGLALENGISGDSLEYFNFLMDKELNSLGEGEEMSEESFASIVTKSKRQNGGTQNDSSVDSKDGNKNPDQNSELTVAEFAKMGLAQKSKLYTEKPEVYKSLFAEAKKQNLIN